MTSLSRSVLIAALGVFALPAAAAELAPGKPALTQELADLRRDAVEVLFDVQFTARQLRDHQRLYAWCWRYATADWQKAESELLPKFKDAFDKDAAHRDDLRNKHVDAVMKDAKAKADLGSPYHRWLLNTAVRAKEQVADGPPALRRDHLDNTLEFIQWGLRMQLTVGQQEEFLKMVPKEWNAVTAAADRKVIIDEFLPLYRKVVRLTPDQRTAVQQVAEKELLEAFKTPESALDKWLADTHSNANKVLAVGPPEALTAGGTLQHADWYDWALGVRLADDTRNELQGLILKDWKEIESTRQPSLSTARFMDDPAKGGAGELRRARDTASLLAFVLAQPENTVNTAAFEAYLKLHPTKSPLPRPSDDTVLAKADKPLTAGVVDCNRLYFEWALGFEFTADERGKLRDLLIDEVARKDELAVAGTFHTAFIYNRLAQLPPEERALLQPFEEERVVGVLRETNKTDRTNGWLLEVYTAKKPPLVKDKPGATQQDADALGEWMHFQVMEVTGGDRATADKVRVATVEKVKAGAALPSQVASARTQLALVTFAWPKLTPDDRQELRDKWANYLEPLGVKPKLAKWQTTPAPSKELDYLDAMKKLQQQQQATAMISNMMRMQHETNMSVIRNIGSSSYRYEYRYEYRRR